MPFCATYIKQSIEGLQGPIPNTMDAANIFFLSDRKTAIENLVTLLF